MAISDLIIPPKNDSPTQCNIAQNAFGCEHENELDTDLSNNQTIPARTVLTGTVGERADMRSNQMTLLPPSNLFGESSAQASVKKLGGPNQEPHPASTETEPTSSEKDILPVEAIGPYLDCGQESHEEAQRHGQGHTNSLVVYKEPTRRS